MEKVSGQSSSPVKGEEGVHIGGKGQSQEIVCVRKD